MKQVLILITLLASVTLSFAQPAYKVTLPTLNDKYSQFAAQLDAGQTAIDYKAFRESLLQSEQSKVVNEKSKQIDSLCKRMILQATKNDYTNLSKTAIAVLDIDYTCIFAHQYLFIAHNVAGNKEIAIKHSSIREGLLNSIIKNGNGESCATAWSIIHPLEQDYIIRNVCKMKNLQITLE